MWGWRYWGGRAVGGIVGCKWAEGGLWNARAEEGRGCGMPGLCRGCGALLEPGGDHWVPMGLGRALQAWAGG